ncbi:MAG: IS3 family transposase, partial [Castellaniella sp.]
MYSYEDRLRAVRLYLKLGRRMGATLRQLGYPSKNSLKVWCMQLEQDQDLPKGYQRAKRRYTDKQKHQAVDHYIEHGHSLMHTIRCLGYPGRETLRIWIGELRPELRKTITGSTTPHNMPRPHATKRQAVVALNTRSGSAKDVADTVGVTRETLYSWHHQLLGYAPLKPMPKKTDTAALEQQRADLLRELSDLEARVRKLRLEHDVLEKASELIKKEMGIHLLGLTNREKTMVVDALKDTYPIALLLQSLQLARSTYFYQRLRQTRPDKYAQVRPRIRSLFAENYRCYGYRRIDAALRRQGVCLSEKVVRRLMAEDSLVVKTPRRHRFSTYAGDPTPAVPNLLNRDFHASVP